MTIHECNECTVYMMYSPDAQHDPLSCSIIEELQLSSAEVISGTSGPGPDVWSLCTDATMH